MSPDSLAADDRIVRTHISEVDAAPLLIEVTRGDMVESVHRGIVSVVDAKGKDVLSLGDIERPTYPRGADPRGQGDPLARPSRPRCR